MKVIFEIKYACLLAVCGLLVILVTVAAQVETGWSHCSCVSSQSATSWPASCSGYPHSRIEPVPSKRNGTTARIRSPKGKSQPAQADIPTKEEDVKKAQSVELFAAIDAGDVQSVSRLLDQEVSVGLTNERGMPPLVFLFSMEPYRGSAKARLEIARLLLSHGADANGLVPLSVNSSGVPVLVWAIHSRSAEVVKLFLKYGANPKIQGCSPLFTAVSLGEKAITEILLDYGADVNARNEYGDTPLFIVDSLEVAKVLVNRGADIKAKNKEGISVLKYLADPYKACGKCGCIPVNEKVVRYLKSKEAN